eukprot:c20152_g1_i1 orf=98-376(+)
MANCFRVHLSLQCSLPYKCIKISNKSSEELHFGLPMGKGTSRLNLYGFIRPNEHNAMQRSACVIQRQQPYIFITFHVFGEDMLVQVNRSIHN